MVASLLLASALVVGDANGSSATRPATFWTHQVRGANCFNYHVDGDWFRAAKAAGIRVVRLAPNKWPSARRDFLIGDCDRYEGLVPEDLAALKAVLDTAAACEMPVVLTTLSLPGARWRQQNGDRFDVRLWTDTAYWTQCEAFWSDLATALRGHPALAGYNIKNEPIPEKAVSRLSEGESATHWYGRVQGTAADLNAFYRRITAAICEVDPVTPIILDAGSWAAPASFEYLKPVDVHGVLYSFHVYEPWEYVNKKANGGRLTYPGDTVDEVCDDKEGVHDVLDSALLRCIVQPVIDWQAEYGVPSSLILVGEFGCHRTTPGAARYLGDLIRLFNTQGWHWMFYSFREDTWDGMDYEIGPGPLGGAYWEAVDRGEHPEPPRRTNEIWDAIERGLRGHR